MPDADRERLGQSFDSASDFYQRARPDYPPALIERILNVTELAPDGRVLEVGCATGKATLPFAQRGFRITCVEPGPALAAAARRNLVGFDAVKIEQVRFEDWVPGPGSFDLVIAAASWSWVDPDVRYRKAADVLRPGGYLAIYASAPASARSSAATFADPQQCSGPIHRGVPIAGSTPICTSKCSSNARQVATVCSKSTPVSIITTRTCGARRSSSSRITDSSF